MVFLIYMLTLVWVFILEYFPACNTLDSFLAILTQEGSIAFVLLNVVIYLLGKCYKCLLCQLEEFEVYLKPLYSIHLGQLNWALLTPPVQRRQWHPNPVLLPGKSHERRSLVGYSPWGRDWATSLSLCTFMHWRRKWQPTPVFLPGESQGRGSLVGCRLWGRTESDTTEAT